MTSRNPFDGLMQKARPQKIANPFSKAEQIGKCNLCKNHFYLPDLEKHTCGTTQNASGDKNSVENDAGSVLAPADTSGSSGISEPVCDTEVYSVRDSGDEVPDEKS